MAERSKSSKNWAAEPRPPGRRAADRGVCIYHDMCHETVAGVKQNGINFTKESKGDFEKMSKLIDTKLPSWVFKLFLSTTIPIVLGLGGWILLNTIETSKIVVRLDTNQVHLMQEFKIDPIKE